MWVFVYNLLWKILAPGIKLYLRFSRKYFLLLNRFFPPIPPLTNPVWIHACSVGEVNQIEPFIKQWHEIFPNISLMLTVSTISGFQQAERKYKEYSINITWCPFDHPEVVESFLKQIAPRLLVIVETELWPNLIRLTNKYHIPIAIINGRISDKFFRLYRRWKKVYKDLIQKINIIMTPTEEYAERFTELGADTQKICVVGNIKYDSVATGININIRNRLRMSLDIPKDAKVIVFGSLRDGDEIVAKRVWEELHTKFPNLFLILAPRHPEKKNQIMAYFGSEPIILRTDNLKGKRRQEEKIIVIDTIGELNQFYSIADVAIIGGSWFPGVDGHNPLEPAGLGVVPIFGPYMRNFQEPAEKLTKDDGAIQLQNYEELPSVIEKLFQSPYESINYGTRARKIVLQNQGAVQKTFSLLSNLIEF
ncbi:MAG TPA: 3-deoxy-D-manno-octulosonic acid transferase [Candidatus Hydrogenedens sp.]|nr:3-deoxy-D-manno-octulosonic acid transferase [Candidatus Hydrogenedens sp.]HOK08401.1 3-deoxy-D-manno-octulosonic acid transferase [Candidatus Hydrogenedens sp.]HOL20701.1 3-deoxy-D-manno-octulosonic acid transferase [Candidatus Hydrogenedens sp.]HPP58186.1 3-deoxy-D-manno-octulosonic acid transferase [Candidatus Hydrogenedens sp.]